MLTSYIISSQHRARKQWWFLMSKRAGRFVSFCLCLFPVLACVGITKRTYIKEHRSGTFAIGALHSHNCTIGKGGGGANPPSFSSSDIWFRITNNWRKSAFLEQIIQINLIATISLNNCQLFFPFCTLYVSWLNWIQGHKYDLIYLRSWL